MIGKEFIDDHIEIVAPVKAREQCIDCHESNVGDTLGAFVYSLTEREE